ncbi:DUF29 domain-containing protein [Geminicoccus roseus]|uniref:DUF29 domain-containing protein n=1 Tax=Geminicoccus roseus TaxID=404900 RepID=UPI000415A1FF|nr:DUF29 domain-containing protein [Geminicoccus roseus]
MAATLYETDYYLWARQQAEALRQLDRERWNGPLDLKQLAEEVDDLAKRDRNACRSQVVRIIEHLLKLDHAPASLPQAGWRRSIFDARAQLEADLTPSLRAVLAEDLPDLYLRGRRGAAFSMEEHGEQDAADGLPAEPPYTLDEVLRDGFYGFAEERRRAGS